MLNFVGVTVALGNGMTAIVEILEWVTGSPKPKREIHKHLYYFFFSEFHPPKNATEMNEKSCTTLYIYK